MALKIVLDDVAPVAEGVWVTNLSPDQLRAIGQAPTRLGDVSVVLLPYSAPPDDNIIQVVFEPGEARVLNAGTGDRAVLVFGRPEPPAGDESEVAVQTYGPAVQHDDEAFLGELEQLPQPLQSLGRRLLPSVRSQYGGYFQRTRIGRYVNRPNNFWTVKVQPRDQSLRITVRGRHHKFIALDKLGVKPDRTGYSNFKLVSEDQYEQALAALRIAAA